MSTTPTLDQLKRGLAISEQIATLQAELASIFNPPARKPGIVWLGSYVLKPDFEKPGKKKGGMSAAGRARVAAAQTKRWALIKKAKVPAAKAPAPAEKKRTMSPETKAKMAAAMKARWAAAKAGKGPAPTASKQK